MRAGLWEKEVRLVPYGSLDFSAILDLAEEQSVVGLVAAGIEHITDGKPAKKDVLQFIGRTVQLEQRNQAMNYFIGVMVDKMQEAGIYTVLVKGQGVAQCYERPLWRACGDVDFFLDDKNYNLAKVFLTPMAKSVEPESGKHLGMTVGPWVVELHGNLHCGLSSKMDSLIDEVQKDVFDGGKVRTWTNSATQVFLPAVDEDVILIFTHFLKHFYKGGLGLRQICDWCRLLWTYRATIDTRKLEEWLNRDGLMSEWKAFGTFAVECLGMPSEAMPFLNMDECTNLKKKADRICRFIMEVGNFGHNRDTSYYGKYSFVVRKAISAWRRTKDLFHHIIIFPLDSLRFFPNIIWNGMKSAARGE